MEREIARGLWWGPTTNGGTVGVGPRREPLLRISVNDGRMRTGALMLEGRRDIDLSGHPAAAVQIVCEQAARYDEQRDGWAGAFSATLSAAAVEWVCWLPGPQAGGGVDRLMRTLGGLRFPALGAAYDAGARTQGEIPRWSRPILTAKTARDAASRAFGARASRPVVRATAEWLLPGRREGDAWVPLRWWPLAVALAGADALEPDHIARLLAVGGDEPERPPKVDDVSLLRASAELLGGERYKAVCEDALVTSRTAPLVHTLRLLHSAKYVLPRPLPMRLDALAHACLSVAALRPRPVAVAAPRPTRATPAPAPMERPVPRPIDPVPPADVPAWARARRAPPTPRQGARPRLDAPARLQCPASLAEFDGLAIGDLTLSVARTANELRQWGRLLHNCLADFVAPATFGATVVIGVRQHERLIGAFEVSPVDRRLVQFVGDRNRPLPESVTTPVRRELARAGLAVG